MTKIDWKKIAEDILIREKSLQIYNDPKPIGVLIKWRNNTYIGSIQEIAPNFSKEIVLLSKSSNPLKDEIINGIRELDEERLELYADDLLDLEGREHIIRRLDNKLSIMTDQQTKYMIKNPIMVHEI